jgi:hypothetical protein
MTGAGELRENATTLVGNTEIASVPRPIVSAQPHSPFRRGTPPRKPREAVAGRQEIAAAVRATRAGRQSQPEWWRHRRFGLHTSRAVQYR